jgi:hypothetical protein
MLEHFGAEASVLDMTIIVRSNPSKAAILEEFLHGTQGNDSNLLIVFYVQIMPDDFVMQLHRF